MASEVKAVLDSWARYEQQVKESEQADLTKNVIASVLASMKDEKTQRDILLSAVVEVERESISFFAFDILLTGIWYTELVKSKAI